MGYSIQSTTNLNSNAPSLPGNWPMNPGSRNAFAAMDRGAGVPHGEEFRARSSKKKAILGRLSRARRAAAYQWLCLAVALIASERQARLQANPTGMSVAAGSAWAKAIGTQLNITTGQAAFLNWSTFNIQAGETTTFLQPSANSVVLNEIGDKNPSQIFGNLNANGTVILANANGFYFGPNSMVKVGGNFIATTAPLTPDFGTGSAWTFTGLPPLASIVNYGQIQAGNGRSLYLIAENIENHGSLNAPAGDIGLYGGESVLVSESPDGRGLSATVKVPQGAVDNLGRITADAGTIAMQAQVVNQNGVVQANSVREQNGVIELVAADSLNLGPNSTISAQGDASSPGSAGGTVTLKAGNTFSDSNGSQITTAGGAQGGNGGNLEVSAPNITSLNSSLDAAAQPGWLGGAFLLDPANLVLTTGGNYALGNTTSGSAANTTYLNVGSSSTTFKSFSQILLEATGNITLGAAWNLSNSTGQNTGSLTLEAGGNITLSSSLTDTHDWSVTMDAGYNPVSKSVVSGTGTISLLNNNTALLTGQGAINLTAGKSILLNSGYVNTSAGGSITMTALAGDINAGTLNAYPNGYGAVYHSGINTYAGGNVTLTAGDDIISNPSYGQNPAGSSGAYGGGNVALTAGNEVKGNFQVTAGTGTILAGVTVASGQPPQILNAGATAGDAVTPLTLSLTTGSWNVWAAADVFIEEARNLNGTFDPGGLYTYGQTAALNVWAGNSITLDGQNLGQGRNGNVTEPVYPPEMNLSAGAGGVSLNSSLILFPSTQGGLQISTTTDRGAAGGTGDLTGGLQADKLTSIFMSDGNPADYTTFLTGPATTTPASLTTPVTLNIAGSINAFGLTVPTFATITVGGDANNFGFLGQNTAASQTTTIKVTGKITYTGDLNSASLTDLLPAAVLNPALSGLPIELLDKLFYNITATTTGTTETLTFVGVMSPAELGQLLNPTVVELDQYGQPVLDANNNPVTVPVTLDATQISAIQQLYTESQSATANDQGLGLYGPGHFVISANSIDLATSGGIYVNTAPLPTFAYAPTTQPGADLTITTKGDLDMTSSQIANAGWQGGISLNVGGTLNVGGADSAINIGDTYAPKGIFTESEGNVSVLAQQAVNVNNSRIAAYNGGNVTVESLNNDVNAGDGGSGHVNVDGVQIDPVSGALVAIPTVGVAGSGILATTIPGSDAQLGNILVESPRGNIVASQGGILQIGLNGTADSAAIAALISGYELRDVNGNPVSAAALGNPRVQGAVAAGTPDDPAQTVLIGGRQLTVSAPVWLELQTLLGVSPTAGQVLNLQVAADQTAFLNALNNGGSGLSAFIFTTFISPSRDVDASGSGIVAQNALAKATGEAKGLFVGFNSVSLDANQLGPSIAYGPTVNITDSGPNGNDLGPTVVQVISDNPVNVNGVTQPVKAPQTVAPATEVATTTEDQNIQAAKTGTDDTGEDPQKKKTGKEIGLARKVSRVTVLLPQKD